MPTTIDHFTCCYIPNECEQQYAIAHCMENWIRVWQHGHATRFVSHSSRLGYIFFNQRYQVELALTG